MKKLIFLGICVSFLIQLGAAAAPNLELVQSVPLGTTLTVPGIRLTQTVWLEMINSATSTLDIEQFYVAEQAGEALTPVIQAIEAAAQRGVRVRLLVDLKFFSTYPETVKLLGTMANVQAKTIDFSSMGGIQHAKFFVVDNNLSYVGSANFDWRALDQIHEIGLRVADAGIAAKIESVFSRDWSVGQVVAAGVQSASAAYPATKKTTGLASIVSVDATPKAVNPPGINFSADVLVAMMAKAKKTIFIQVYEYGVKNWTVLDDAIRQAAARGVNVSLMVDEVDLKNAQNELLALSHLQNITVKTIKIPEWSGGPVQFGRLIHSKYMVVDGTSAWVGSANWIESYFTGTRNVGLTVQSPQVSAQLTSVFNTVWNSAYGTLVH